VSVPVSTLSHIAALAASVPHLTVALDTHSGSAVTVGDGPEASMCAHAFRQVVANWPEDGDHAPCVDQIRFDGADERGPVLATGRVRWFVSDLSAQDTIAALRGARPEGPRGPRVDTRVRHDATLGVSIVRMESAELDHVALDERATAAYAACLAEHLIGAAAIA